MPTLVRAQHIRQALLRHSMGCHGYACVVALTGHTRLIHDGRQLCVILCIALESLLWTTTYRRAFVMLWRLRTRPELLQLMTKCG